MLDDEAANQYPLQRTARQRRYDALVAIFVKAADSPGPAGTTARVPLINIFCTETTLQAAICDYFGTANAEPGEATDPSPSERLRLSETASGPQSIPVIWSSPP